MGLSRRTPSFSVFEMLFTAKTQGVIMSNKDDSLGALILGGGIGYLLAQGQNSEWKPVIDSYKRRLQQISFARIPFPVEFLRKNQNIRRIYSQSLSSYLFGLPDACMPVLIRVLEQALKVKFAEAEGKKPPRDYDLAKLIDWSQSFLKDKALVAHSFRILRNLVHTEELVQEQDCLEAIRHVNIIIENLFPGNSVMVQVSCQFCGRSGVTPVSGDFRFLGSSVALQCDQCRRTYNGMLMP